jgi:CRISPR-associated protein Csd1
MILQALYEYYNRISQEDGDVAPEGFEKKEIPFLIILDRKGEFVGIQDTREGEGKKKNARSFIVPRSVKRTVGVAANLLWDTPAYVFGRPKPVKDKDPALLVERAKLQQEAFIARIRETFPEPRDESIQAVLTFLNNPDKTALFNHPCWKEIEETGANLSFRIDAENHLVFHKPAVMKSLSSGQNVSGNNTQQCLVTGGLDEPVRLHAAIKGVWGAQSSGANIVSFNLDAFRSYEKEQGYNAPVGKKAESAYTTALNTLLMKDSPQRIQVGDASTVFWAARKNQMEEIFADFFRVSSDETSQDFETIKALFNAPSTGILPVLDDPTAFYVLGLSPNASRISVRFWYAGTVGDVAANLRLHLNDITIEHRSHEPDFLTLFRLLTSTAVQGKSENIPPNLGGEFMKSILTGAPYPQTLLSSVIRRIRAEQDVTYPRAAIIKAVLNREIRYYKKIQKEVNVSLDVDNTNPGYLLGRLFAALERAQELANPNLNATIRDRFYGSASSTPVAAFPHLLKLKNYHIAKLENKGTAVNLEKLIGEIMNGLGSFPPHLSLADQGRFAIGYYHQRNSFFNKVNSSEK